MVQPPNRGPRPGPRNKPPVASALPGLGPRPLGFISATNAPPVASYCVSQDQAPLVNAQAGAVLFKCVGMLLAASAAVASAQLQFGTHEAAVKQASQGASWNSPNYAAQIAPPAPLVAYVAQAPPDWTQVAPQISPGLGAKVAAPIVRPWAAFGQVDGNQVSAVWVAPNYAQQIVAPPVFAPDSKFGAHQDAVYNAQARGAVYPVVPTIPVVTTPTVARVAWGPLQDPTQIQPQIWSPNFSEGIPVPLTAAIAPEQDVPPQSAPTWMAPNHAAQIFPTAPRGSYIAAPQIDPTQIAAQIVDGLGPMLPAPTVRPTVTLPQVDVSQAAPSWTAPIYSLPAAPPIFAPYQKFGTHQEAVYNSQAGGQLFRVAPLSISAPAPQRPYVARAQDDPTQIQPQVSDGLGYTLPEPLLRPSVALPQADPTQVPAAWQAPNYAAQVITVPPPAIQYVSRPQDDTTGPQPITRQALGFTLAAPPLRSWVSAPQADPSQPAAVILAPNYAPQAAPTTPPVVPFVTRPQDDPTQVQPVTIPAPGFTRAAPIVRPYVALPQADPTQIPAQIEAGLGSSLAVPPIRPFVSIPQADVSQIAAFVSPGLGSTLARPPIVPFEAIPQADPTQVPPVTLTPNYATQAVIVSTPQPGMVFAYQADPTQIPATWASPNYAVQVVPVPAGLDPTTVGRRKHTNVTYTWGSPGEPKPAKVEKNKASKPKPAAPSKLLLSLFAKGGIGEMPFPATTAPAEPARTEKVRVPDKPWPAPAPRVEPPPAVDPEKLALEARAAEAVAEAARLKDEIERVQERMVAIEAAMEAQLDEGRRDAAAHARRARAAEDETTREIARRVEEQRLAEEDLRRARNNLIAIQAAIQVFFSDDPDSL